MNAQHAVRRLSFMLLALVTGGALFLTLLGTMGLVWAKESGQANSTDEIVSFRLGWRATDLDDTRSVAWGDVDNDGDLDLAVGNWDEPNKVYLNSGGSLEKTAAWIAPKAEGTTSLAWGDMDNDGDLDLAVGNMNAPNRIYLNESGRLATIPIWRTPVIEQTASVAWGDMNGDGRLDLAVGNTGAPSKVYLNENGNLLMIPTWTTSITEGVTSVAWGDMNGDGRLDLAVGSNPVRVYLNENGTLMTVPTWTPLSQSNDTVSIAWGDIDGDEHEDLAIGEWTGHLYEVEIFLNDGTLLQKVASQTLALSWGGYSLAWGDIDQDGDLDLATSSRGVGAGASVYVNDAGRFRETVLTISSRIEDTTSVAWGDVDGDSDLDLAVGTGVTGDTVYLNVGGNLGSTPPMQISEVDAYRLAWADTSGDRHLDLIAAPGGLKDPILAFFGTGSGLEVTATTILSNTNDVIALAWGDIDGDGTLDVATGSNGVYLTSGNLLSAASWITLSEENSSLAWGDVDNDGDLDLAIGNKDGPNRVYLNDQGRSLSIGWVASVTETTVSVAWGDVDDDGDLDLAVGNYDSPNRVYYNTNGVLEKSASWYAVGINATRSVAWGDVNNDGALDLAVGSLLFPTSVHINRLGRLEQTPSWESQDSESTESVALRDINGDGDMDLTASGGRYARFRADGSHPRPPTRVYLNRRGVLQSDATWTEWLSDPTGIAWGDMDSDGDFDLAVADYAGIKVYMAQQPAHPFYPWRNGASQRPIAIVADLYSDPVPTFSGSTVATLAPADQYAVPAIRRGVIPITYTLYHPGSEPMREVKAFYSLNGGGHWQEAVAATRPITTELATLPYPQREITNTHVYYWDVNASGFFGQSDNVVMRLVAYPSLRPRPNGIPGPFQRPFVSTQTYPFRVRGNQVQVISATVPISNAVVYQLPAGQTQGATLIGAAGEPFRTAPTGFLPGRGELKQGDRLAALYPTDVISSHTPTRLYFNQDGRLPLTITGSQTTTLSLIITDTRRFADLDVLVDISHTVGSDLRATLIAPDGKETTLFTSTATVGNGVIALSFDDEAPALFGRGLFTETAEPLTPLNGRLLNGAWRLRLENRGQGAASIVNGWGLALKVSDLFYTSAAPTISGLEMYTVTTGVQTLTVTSTNPLLIFDLDVALEWDARNDSKYLSQLRFDLKRASEFLYDWTNGQVALGRIKVFHDAKRNTFPGYGDPWGEADVRIYATNRLRPNAVQGGIVSEPFTDTMKGIGAKEPNVYMPGQVSMGAVWNRFGDSSGNLGEDWARTLAHELGHYLLFLDDNYLGTKDGLLVTVNDCPGAMADHYRDDVEKLNGVEKHYGEFAVADDFRNITQCQQTLSAQRTGGRSDWETIRVFYPALHAPAAGNPRNDEGPATQPLDLTQVDFVEPISPTKAFIAPIISLKYGGQATTQTANARVFLFKANGDWLVDLGRPQLDQVVARGMEAGDRLCVFDTTLKRIGCEATGTILKPELSKEDLAEAELQRGDMPRTWLPQIRIVPADVDKVRVEVTGVDANELHVRLFPQDFPASEAKRLESSNVEGDRNNPIFSATFPLTATSSSGYIHVWAGPIPDGKREIVTDYALGGSPSFGEESTSLAKMRSLSIAKMRALSLARMRSLSIAKMRSLSIAKMRSLSLGKMRSYAAAMSSDGQVILFGDDLSFKEGQYITLQAATSLSETPSWATLVGQAYRLEASAGVNLTRTASLSFAYLGSDVPVGEESGLRIHFWNGKTWEELPTVLDPDNNYASAQLQGPGIYALMTSIELPLQRGWNLIGYPVQTSGVPTATRQVTEVLQSIAGNYAAIYSYDASNVADPWQVYGPAPETPAFVSDLAALEFGRGYWINITATDPITLHLRGSWPNTGAEATQPKSTGTVKAAYRLPPTTYYGQVTASANFSPTAGQPVLALVDGVVCGRGWTRANGDSVVYDVAVEAASPDNGFPCGSQGKQVTFTVNDQEMARHAAWSDAGLQTYNLAPPVAPLTAASCPACTELIAGGDFEDRSPWITAQPKRVTLAPGEGQHDSQALKIDVSGNTTVKIERRLVLPGDAQSLILRFAYRKAGQSSVGSRLTLRVNGKIVWEELAISPQWQNVTIGLTPWRGREVILVLETHPLNPQYAMGLLLDDVSLQADRSESPTH